MERRHEPREAGPRWLSHGRSVPDHQRSSGAADASELYKRAFAATEMMRHAEPSGKVRHAEIKIGDSPIIIADELPGFSEHTRS